MKPRITISTNGEGELEVWLNEAGRDLLVKELQGLSAERDHFHLQTEGLGEVPLQGRAYRDGDRVLQWGKVLFRPDEWDRRHSPHVLGPGEASDG
ncbi:hypothetical protein VQH23_09160 [Pararoseomonas sp. SCSIO 73927]|uniref:hypothetical protein n=1 Tax=Pararoseomonas sp. SCSIO 73927 TaxID=3114537 RepID=UPI0030D1878C